MCFACLAMSSVTLENKFRCNTGTEVASNRCIFRMDCTSFQNRIPRGVGVSRRIFLLDPEFPEKSIIRNPSFFAYQRKFQLAHLCANRLLAHVKSYAKFAVFGCDAAFFLKARLTPRIGGGAAQTAIMTIKHVINTNAADTRDGSGS